MLCGSSAESCSPAFGILCVLPEQGQGELAQGCEVVWCVVFADPAVVLAKRDIEHPIQTIFDAPMTAYCLGEGFGGRYALAAEIAGAPYGDRAVEFSPALDHADTGRFGPVLPELSVQPGDVGDPQRLAGFDAAI